MKAITIWEPYATAIALGHKRYETRSWTTRYRGNLAIHASKKKSTALRAEFDYLKNEFPTEFGHLEYDELPFGCVVAACRLINCYSTTRSFDKLHLTDLEYSVGNFMPGRFAWELELIKLPNQPIPAVGKQGIWEWMTK